jgi:hypothetical protein
MRMTLGELRKIIRETVKDTLLFETLSPEEIEMAEAEAEERAKNGGLSMVKIPKGMSSEEAHAAYNKRKAEMDARPKGMRRASPGSRSGMDVKDLPSRLR